MLGQKPTKKPHIKLLINLMWLFPRILPQHQPIRVHVISASNGASLDSLYGKIPNLGLALLIRQGVGVSRKQIFGAILLSRVFCERADHRDLTDVSRLESSNCHQIRHLRECRLKKCFSFANNFHIVLFFILNMMYIITLLLFLKHVHFIYPRYSSEQEKLRDTKKADPSQDSNR